MDNEIRIGEFTYKTSDRNPSNITIYKGDKPLWHLNTSSITPARVQLNVYSPGEFDNRGELKFSNVFPGSGYFIKELQP